MAQTESEIVQGIGSDYGVKNLHVALAEDGTQIVKGVDLAVSTTRCTR